MDPFKASIPRIADLFLHLFDSGFQMGSIKGYRAAIASTLKHFDRDIGTNTILTELMKSLAIERPRNLRTMPPWDLPLVLRFLISRQFDHIEKKELKWITLKTAFLMALASACRVSELHALDITTFQFAENYSQVSMAPNILFLAKNQTPEELQRSLRIVKIKALSSVATEDNDKHLCPVRALRYYLDMTANKRRVRGRLFLSYIAPYKEASKSTIASWIKKTIKLVYQQASSSDLAVSQIRAHDIRGFSTSWAFRNAVPLLDVLRAGCWKCHSTFSDFYLKDVTTIRDDMRNLGSLSVAQHVVSTQ